MNNKQKKELIKIFEEIGEAMDYVPDNSPASFAIAVPYASLCTFLTENGVTADELGIVFTAKVKGKKGKK